MTLRTVKEAAAEIGCSANHIHHHIRLGNVPVARKIGGAFLLDDRAMKLLRTTYAPTRPIWVRARISRGEKRTKGGA